MNLEIMSSAELRRRLSDRVVKVVAERIGISAMTLYRIQKNECEPRLSTLVKLSEYFRLHP